MTQHFRLSVQPSCVPSGAVTVTNVAPDTTSSAALAAKDHEDTDSDKESSSVGSQDIADDRQRSIAGESGGQDPERFERTCYRRSSNAGDITH